MVIQIDKEYAIRKISGGIIIGGLSMSKYSREKVIQRIKSSVYSNANQLNMEQCYYVCANKQVFDELLKRECQIIFGRRGTGKTTTLKAFTHYVNQVRKEEHPGDSCWYVRLDECIPNSIEIMSGALEDNIAYCVQNMLLEFTTFLMNEFTQKEKTLRPKPKKFGQVEDDILKLAQLIEEGKKKITLLTGTESSQHTNAKESEFSLSADTSDLSQINHILSKLLSMRFSFGKKAGREIRTTKDKQYVYRIDINEIRRSIEKILKTMGYRTLYICIDEFTQIDRDTSTTIQPKVAQVLKQLFFSSSIIVVKIASVWSEYRMQTRQEYGFREGIELSQDIFKHNSINFDSMFDYNNEKAYQFFKDAMLNFFLFEMKHDEFIQLPNGLIVSPRIVMTEEERNGLANYLVELLFSKDSFKHLICGSQGIPRVFGILLVASFDKLKEVRKEKVTVEIVFDCIMDNYFDEVRQSIPESSEIFTGIEAHIGKTKNRFFLLSIIDYNTASFYFDRLVAVNALYEYTSKVVPRELRNSYKLYCVHYGNYLDSFKRGMSKLNNDTMVGQGFLFPKFPDDMITNPQKYAFMLPEKLLEEAIFSICKREIREESIMNNSDVKAEDLNTP